MMDRRQFIRNSSLSIATLAVAGSAAGSEDVSRTLALYDGSYAQSLRFAAAVRESGYETLDTRLDIVRQWYAGLGQVCAKPGIRLVGLTTFSDLELLQDCVRPFGLRVRAATFPYGPGGSLVQWEVAQ